MNDAPVAVDDAATTTEETAVTRHRCSATTPIVDAGTTLTASLVATAGERHR